MKFNDHGAETNNIYKNFDVVKPHHIIDFSTNTNVIELDENVKSRLNSLDFSSYPDSDNKSLKTKVLHRLNNKLKTRVSEENILMTNGSNEAIYIIASYFSQHHIAILQPTYPEYEKAFLAYDASVDYCYQLTDLVDKKYSCVVICNPNNPTGEYIKWNELETVIKQLKALDVTVIIDEAYIDFLCLEDETSLNKYNYIKEHTNMLILRSLTKIYQMAGLRLGYVISHPMWINQINKRQATWSVNSVATKVALQYLEDDTIISLTKAYYTKETKRVIEALRILDYEIKESSVNFYLIKIPDDISIIKYLLTKGIIVRHTRNHPSLNGDYIRIAVRTSKENDYLIQSLEFYNMKKEK